MRILVAYATRYGATTGIADRIGGRLAAAGFDVDVLPVGEVADIEPYDAAVIGSAVYIGRWLPEAAAFAEERAPALASRPTWLFSSGPLGTEPTDARGRDLREVAEPEEHRTLGQIIGARGTAVFFGALVASELSFKHRSARRLPVGRELLPEGDFRDWATIGAWADSIVRELQGVDATA